MRYLAFHGRYDDLARGCQGVDVGPEYAPAVEAMPALPIAEPRASLKEVPSQPAY